VIDYGLLVSLIIGFGVPSLLINWWPLTSYDEPVGFLDVTLGAAFTGLAVGRLTTLALDDPSSIGSISDMIIIRSGVEFWPGVAAASAVLMWSARRDKLPLLTRVADLAPLSMIGYASYEAACVFRDGCFGPETAIGLRPPGLSATMLPVGLFLAAGVALAAIGVHTLAVRRRPAVVIICVAAISVAAIRSIASIWLPHVGNGLTRQHVTSIVIFLTAAIILGVALFAPTQRGAKTEKVRT